MIRPGEPVRVNTCLRDDRGAATERGAVGRVLEEARRAHDGERVQVVRFQDGSVAEVPTQALERS
jgi:hypothetical protein